MYDLCTIDLKVGLCDEGIIIIIIVIMLNEDSN